MEYTDAKKVYLDLLRNSPDKDVRALANPRSSWLISRGWSIVPFSQPAPQPPMWRWHAPTTAHNFSLGDLELAINIEQSVVRAEARDLYRRTYSQIYVTALRSTPEDPLVLKSCHTLAHNAADFSVNAYLLEHLPPG